jgi:hypothetical protein
MIEQRALDLAALARALRRQRGLQSLMLSLKRRALACGAGVELAPAPPRNGRDGHRTHHADHSPRDDGDDRYRAAARVSVFLTHPGIAG